MNAGHGIPADYNPTTPLAFDDAGEPVLVTHPEVYDDPHDEVFGADAQSIIAAFLRLMTTDAPALLIGQRVMLLAYLSGQTDFKTHHELATRLNVSPGRVSQILRALPKEFAALARLKSRTAKAHRIGRDGKIYERHRQDRFERPRQSPRARTDAREQKARGILARPHS